MYKLDLIITDELWAQIKPQNKPKEAGMLLGYGVLTINLKQKES